MCTNVRLYLSYDPKTTMKSRFFLCENAKILPYIREVITDIHTVTKICGLSSGLSA